MANLIRIAVVLGLLATSTLAAAYTKFRIDQIFSNADGTVQYVVLRECCNVDGDHLWVSQVMRSTGPGGERSFTFPADLPNTDTGQKFVLVATQGYAALGVVAPDYIMPDNFLQVGGGTLNFASVHEITHGPMPTDGVTALNAAGDVVNNVATNFAGAFGSITVAAPPATNPVALEYYNAALDHYFVTHVPGEIAALDAGIAIKGWARTQQQFPVFGSALGGTSPVCRFYIPPEKGDSHFYGRGAAECSATGQNNPTFVNEDPQFFHVVLPQGGSCPPLTIPLYRVFSNRADANHRYTIDRAIRDTMVSQRGWLAEGDGPDLVVMCVPPPQNAKAPVTHAAKARVPAAR